jgi:membrane protein implicated in regulation of membrane protease activity
MLELFSGLSALTVFLLIAAAGFLFLVLSFFFNDLFEHFGGLSVDHVDVGTDGIGVLDSRVISIFITAFGCIGAVGVQLGASPTLSGLLGLLSGVLLGAVVYYFGKLLYHQQASSSVSAHQLIGRLAEVTVTIQPGTVGRISCRVGEERVEKLARSRADTEIKIGSTVRIEELAGEAVIVSLDDSARRLYLSH